MYYCCLEHVEQAMDDIVDEYQVAPIIEKIDEIKQLSTSCKFCNSEAVYVISE